MLFTLLYTTDSDSNFDIDSDADSDVDSDSDSDSTLLYKPLLYSQTLFY